MLNEMILERGTDDHDVITAAIEKSCNATKSAMQRASFTTGSNCSQRFRPQVANFENKRNALPPRYPPSRKSDQQLRRRADHNVRLRQTEAAHRCRQKEGSIVTNPLVSFPIGQRPEPGSHHLHSRNFFF